MKNRPFQSAAVLLLCRLTLFFCEREPFSSAAAAGMLLGMLPVSAFWLAVRPRPVPQGLLPLYQGFAVVYGGWLGARLFGLLPDLHTPAQGWFCVFAALTLADMVRRPAATGRAAVICLLLTAAGMLSLPLHGARRLEPLALAVPGSPAAAFFRELRLSAESALVPVLFGRAEARRGVRGWALARLLLPLPVLYGAAVVGRLGRQGSQFLLVLLRTPLSDTLRTDGFWMLVILCAGLLAMTFCAHQSQKALPALTAELLLTAAFLLTGYDGEGLGLAALVLGFLPFLTPAPRQNAKPCPA